LTSEELIEALHRAQVDPAYWSIGADRHEALCLVREHPGWRVFLSERGEHYEERTFLTEDAACAYFAERVHGLWNPAAPKS
jgi:hypothetical protein